LDLILFWVIWNRNEWRCLKWFKFVYGVEHIQVVRPVALGSLEPLDVIVAEIGEALSPILEFEREVNLPLFGDLELLRCFVARVV
jgi:hypothetical protein